MLVKFVKRVTACGQSAVSEAAYYIRLSLPTTHYGLVSPFKMCVVNGRAVALLGGGEKL